MLGKDRLHILAEIDLPGQRVAGSRLRSNGRRAGLAEGRSKSKAPGRHRVKTRLVIAGVMAMLIFISGSASAKKNYFPQFPRFSV